MKMENLTPEERQEIADRAELAFQRWYESLTIPPPELKFIPVWRYL
jgi:hypothetical protein